MTAPVTHIVFAVLISHLLPSHFDFKEFIVGTSFPDIRYAANLKRTETHFEPISWNSVLHASTAFEAGIIFHNLLDIHRMEYLDVPFFQEHDNYSHRTSASTLKLCEDIILYPLLSAEEWDEICTFFDEQYLEELSRTHNNQSVINQWHNALKEYFQSNPNLERFESFIFTTGGNSKNHKETLDFF